MSESPATFTGASRSTAGELFLAWSSCDLVIVTQPVICSANIGARLLPPKVAAMQSADLDIENTGCQRSAFNPASYLGKRGLSRSRSVIGKGRESAIVRSTK